MGRFDEKKFAEFIEDRGLYFSQSMKGDELAFDFMKLGLVETHNKNEFIDRGNCFLTQKGKKVLANYDRKTKRNKKIESVVVVAVVCCLILAFLLLFFLVGIEPSSSPPSPTISIPGYPYID